MRNIIVPSLMQLVDQSPVLLAYLVGLILALVFWRRYPAPCLLTLIATSLLLAVAVTQPFVTQYLLQARAEMDGSDEKLRWTLSAAALTSGLLRAIALGFLLAAVFLGRQVAQRPVPDPPQQPTGPAVLPQSLLDGTSTPIKRRDLGVMVLLFVVTLGIYGFFLIPDLGRSVNTAIGRNKYSYPVVLVVSIVTLGLALGVYEILYAYDLERKGGEAKPVRRAESLGSYVLILDIVAVAVAFLPGGLAFIVSAFLGTWATWLVQKEINWYAEANQIPVVVPARQE